MSTLKYYSAAVVFVFALMSQTTLAATTSDADHISKRLSMIMDRLLELQAMELPTGETLAVTVSAAEEQKLRITVSGEETYHETALNEGDAMRICEKTAYNTSNMWKAVTCAYGTTILYNDIFIAG